MRNNGDGHMAIDGWWWRGYGKKMRIHMPCLIRVAQHKRYAYYVHKRFVVEFTQRKAFWIVGKI